MIITLRRSRTHQGYLGYDVTLAAAHETEQFVVGAVGYYTFVVPEEMVKETSLI